MDIINKFFRLIFENKIYRCFVERFITALTTNEEFLLLEYFL